MFAHWQMDQPTPASPPPQAAMRPHPSPSPSGPQPADESWKVIKSARHGYTTAGDVESGARRRIMEKEARAANTVVDCSNDGVGTIYAIHKGYTSASPPKKHVHPGAEAEPYVSGPIWSHTQGATTASLNRHGHRHNVEIGGVDQQHEDGTAVSREAQMSMGVCINKTPFPGYTTATHMALDLRHAGNMGVTPNRKSPPQSFDNQTRTTAIRTCYGGTTAGPAHEEAYRDTATVPETHKERPPSPIKYMPTGSSTADYARDHKGRNDPNEIPPNPMKTRDPTLPAVTIRSNLLGSTFTSPGPEVTRDPMQADDPNRKAGTFRPGPQGYTRKESLPVVNKLRETQGLSPKKRSAGETFMPARPQYERADSEVSTASPRSSRRTASRRGSSLSGSGRILHPARGAPASPAR